jgi:nucleotide-binding universal stress UspA family protein
MQRRMYQRILVASDLTQQSISSLRAAAELGRAFGPKITVAHVIAMPPVLRRWKSDVFREDLDTYHELLARQVGSATAELERQVSSAGLVSKRGVKIVVRAGDPAPILAELAAALGADLVIASRGRAGVLGSVAERLVRLVGRSVLVTPAPSRRAAIGKPKPRRGRAAV